MVKRKVFYTMVQEKNVVGIVKQDGFEVEVDGEIFNAYRNREKDRAYIIDTKTGLALKIYDYDYDYDLPTEIEMIEKAREKLIADKEGLQKWREQRNRESYKLTVQLFAAYQQAEELREKQKDAVIREITATEREGVQ